MRHLHLEPIPFPLFVVNVIDGERHQKFELGRENDPGAEELYLSVFFVGENLTRAMQQQAVRPLGKRRK